MTEHQPVQVHKNTVPPDAIQELTSWFYKRDHSTDQRPDCHSKAADWQKNDWPKNVLQGILDSVHAEPYAVETVYFFLNLTSRFTVHVDSGYGLDQQALYQVIIVPLSVQGNVGTVFFDNHWYHRCAKFSKKPWEKFGYHLVNLQGEETWVPDIRSLYQDHVQGKSLNYASEVLENLESLVNKRDKLEGYHPRNLLINDYSEIENYTTDVFDEDARQRYLAHIEPEELQGLTFDRYVPWTPGDVITFPRTQLHAASTGPLPKLCVSIFTNRI